MRGGGGTRRNKPEGGFCKASELFLYSAGDLKKIVVLVLVLRERRESKKEDSCGHSLYSRNIFLGIA